MVSVKEFIRAYTGWAKDVDGAAGIQCVDLAKEHFRIAGDPNWQSAIGGDGYSDNIWYNRQRWSPWYLFINPKDGFKDGDMVIFPHKDRGGWTHPSSHVCFYYQGKEFGTNQGQKPACLKSTDWSDALGALRWKEWAGEFLPYGYTKLIRSGITALVYRGNSAAGYRLHVLSADGPTALKDIEDFDSDKLQKVAVVNAGYFQMEDGKADPIGTHYGVEQDAAAAALRAQQEAQENANASTVVITTKVNVRDTPSEAGNAIGTLDGGTKVVKYGEENGFTKINFNGGRAYVKSDFVVPEGQPAPQPEAAPAAPANTTVTLTSTVNARASKDETSDRVAVGVPGDVVTILGDAGDGWSRVSIKGIEGYMKTEFLH